jgi:hypothetical protein
MENIKETSSDKVKRIAVKLAGKDYRNVFILIALIIAGSYYYIREFFIQQNAWSVIKVSNVTINMLLVYFLWGYWCEKYLKKTKQMRRIIYEVSGLCVITVIFKFGFGLNIL